ncbi:MAG TPA: SRPBCC domain-containing protein [Balneolaceae bacterium]
MIRCEPPRLLSYTWGGDSEVTFELIPQDEDILLVLTHRRLEDAEMISVAAGWHTHLAILADQLNERQPRGFWRVHTKLENEYKKRLG